MVASIESSILWHITNFGLENFDPFEPNERTQFTLFCAYSWSFEFNLIYACHDIIIWNYLGCRKKASKSPHFALFFPKEESARRRKEKKQLYHPVTHQFIIIIYCREFLILDGLSKCLTSLTVFRFLNTFKKGPPELGIAHGMQSTNILITLFSLLFKMRKKWVLDQKNTNTHVLPPYNVRIMSVISMGNLNGRIFIMTENRNWNVLSLSYQMELLGLPTSIHHFVQFDVCMNVLPFRGINELNL